MFKSVSKSDSSLLKSWITTHFWMGQNNIQKVSLNHAHVLHMTAFGSMVVQTYSHNVPGMWLKEIHPLMDLLCSRTFLDQSYVSQTSTMRVLILVYTARHPHGWWHMQGLMWFPCSACQNYLTKCLWINLDHAYYRSVKSAYECSDKSQGWKPLLTGW